MPQPSIKYYSAVDTEATTKKALEVRCIPHVILIDPQGVVRWEGYPLLQGSELNAEKIKTLIKKYGKKTKK